MIPELGHFALIIALCNALLLASLPLIGSLNGRISWMQLARPAAAVQLFFVTISYVALTMAFVNNDFSVLYVASQSNSGLPLVYRIAAVWGGHEGSILMWIGVLALWTGAVAVFSRAIPLVLIARVLAVLGMISVGLILFVLLTSNPFERLFPIPADGASLNPLLQDPGMAIHPPMLYFGYVGFAVAFAFAIAALIGGQLDAATTRYMRPWTNIAWMFLTIGIALGSWWAYYELGWGGWWFWDPVENASFMPWLVGTALIHSLAASEKRGVFKAWTVLLAVLAFSLSLLGTFLVRSGVLTSVHAFAVDPERGLFILMFLGVAVGGSLLLFSFRAHRLRSTASYALFSRESGLLLNNVLLVVACAAVLIGTLYPLVIDALDIGKMSVGEQYFRAVFVPLTAPLVLAVGVGSLMNWKQDRLAGRSTILAIIGVAAIALAAWIASRYDRHQIAAFATIGMALWVTGSIAFGVLYRVRNKKNRLAAVLQAPASFWGMNLAHLGLAVFVVGVGLVSLFAEEVTVRMEPGSTYEMGRYEFEFDGLSDVRGPNYNAARGVFNITRDDGKATELTTEKRLYDVRSDTMTEAGIDAGFTRDLFVALGEPLDDQATAWSVRLQHKPFIRWIWLGCILMAAGGLLAATDKRYRVKSRVAVDARAQGSVQAGGASVLAPGAVGTLAQDGG